MEPSDVGLPRDVMGVATFGRDASVEALPQLCDDQIGSQLERQIQLDDIVRLVCQLGGCFPLTRSMHLQPHIGSGIMSDACRALPGERQGHGSDQIPSRLFVKRRAHGVSFS